MYGVVQPRAVAPKHLQGTVRVPRGAAQGVGHHGAVVMEGAAGKEAKAPRRREPKGLPGEPLVAVLTRLEILATLNEGRGIDDNHIEALPRIGLSLQYLEGVAPDRLHPVG